MIDCSITENYFSEKKRMCDTLKSCSKCDFFHTETGHLYECDMFQKKFTSKSIAIVQEWSNAHPQQTMRDKFFEIFPEAPRNENGNPECCIENLGWVKECDNGRCFDCWKKPYIVKE